MQSAPIVVNGIVYVGSSEGTLFAVDGATGHQLWSASTGGAIGAPNEYWGGLVPGIAAGQGVLIAGGSADGGGTVLKAYGSIDSDGGM